VAITEFFCLDFKKKTFCRSAKLWRSKRDQTCTNDLHTILFN